MPPLPAVADAVKIVTSGALLDSEWLNIWHMSYSGDAPDHGDLLNFLNNYWIPSWDTAFAAEASVANHTLLHVMTDLASDTGAEASNTDDTAGVREDNVSNGASCVMGSLEINRRYRGGHPRKYLPFGTSGTLGSDSSRYWDTGFIADVQTKMATFIGAVNDKTEGSTTFQSLVNVSYVTGGERRVTPVVDNITGITIKDRVCTQRRRLGKGSA